MVKNLKSLRIEAGMSQQQLASVVNISQQSVNKYENHDVEPGIETLCAFSDLFGVSLDYLVGRSDKKTQDLSDALICDERERKLLLSWRRLGILDKKMVEEIIERLKA